jgi:hypothetical protein
LTRRGGRWLDRTLARSNAGHAIMLSPVDLALAEARMDLPDLGRAGDDGLLAMPADRAECGNLVK